MTLEEIAKEIGVSKVPFPVHCPVRAESERKTRNRILEVAKRGRRAGGDGADPNGDAQHRRGTAFRRFYYGSGVYFQNCLLGVCESASMLGYNVLITTSNAHDISELQSLVESNRGGWYAPDTCA